LGRQKTIYLRMARQANHSRYFQWLNSRSERYTAHLAAPLLSFDSEVPQGVEKGSCVPVIDPLELPSVFFQEI